VIFLKPAFFKGLAGGAFTPQMDWPFHALSPQAFPVQGLGVFPLLWDKGKKKALDFGNILAECSTLSFPRKRESRLLAAATWEE